MTDDMRNAPQWSEIEAELSRVPARDQRAIDRIMDAVEKSQAPRERRPLALLRRYAAHRYAVPALLAASTVLALMWTLQARPDNLVTADANAGATTATERLPGALQAVRFEYPANDVKSIALAGDFNDWSPTATELRRDGSGRWTVTLSLPPGRHAYVFVVDGERWVPDANAPRAPESELGGPSSVVFVSSGT